MNCQTVQENLTAYLHNELSIAEVQQLHRHLADCSSCAAEEMELRKTQQLLGRYREISLPPDFHMQLTRKIKRLRSKKSFNLIQVISSAAAAILLTIGIQYLITAGESHSLPAHFSLFQKNRTAVTEENFWEKRMLDKLTSHPAKLLQEE